MKIYIYCDFSKLEDKEEKAKKAHLPAIKSKLAEFIQANESLKASLVNSKEPEQHLEALKLGLQFHAKKPVKLKVAVQFFNQLAKEYRLDFEVGEIVDDNEEVVSYFGFEEGPGDGFLIAQYLGL